MSGLLGVTLTLLTPFAAGPARAANAATVPSAVPASFTPKINDGIVYALGQVGSEIVAGGSFTNVSPAGSTKVLAHNAIVAFNAGTGAISSTFAPTIKGGTVFSILPGPAAGEVYVAGSFSSIDGVNTKAALLNLSNGAIVSSWTSPGFNRAVYTMQRSGGRLFVGGAFTSVGGQTHNGLVALNPSTGAVTDYVQLSFTGHHAYGTKCNPTKQSCAQGTPQVKAITINPAGTRLVAIGNFINVGTVGRDQIAEVNLGSTSATLNMSWKTDTYTAPCLVTAYDMDVRDVDFAPDGSYFVVVATGAGALSSLSKNVDGTTAPCDGAARFNTADTGQDVQPVWEDLTGNDTFWSVAVTNGAVYAGGHQRWVNNPLASDTAGPGSVPRPGLVALDPVSGLPIAWNPGRNPRGAGCYAILATPQGIWIGSDTDYIGDRKYLRPKVAFFPYAGGYTPASDTTPQLPGRVFSVGDASSGAIDPARLSYRVTDGTSFGTERSVNSGIDWGGVDGAFYVDGKVIFGQSDGNLYERSFDGTTFGSPVQIDPYDDPTWSTVETGSDPEDDQTYRGERSDFAAEIPSVTSMAFASGRLFYTLAGQTAMHWRWFEPDDGIVGASEFTVSGTTDWSTVRGAFISAGRFYWGDSTTGKLDSIVWAGTHPTGSAKVSDSSTDWASRGLFVLPNSVAPVSIPEAAFDVDCSSSPTCTFTAADWVDPDGGTTEYAWAFGDGKTAPASRSDTVTHRYETDKHYLATLTVTSTGGGKASVSHDVDIEAPSKRIAFAGGSHRSAVARSVRVALPKHLKKDDEVVLIETAAARRAGLTVPAGWTWTGHEDAKGVSSTVLIRRLPAATDAGHVTLHFAKKVPVSVVVTAYRNVSTHAVESIAGATHRRRKTHRAPALRGLHAGSWVVWAWGQYTRKHSGWAPPRGRSIRARTGSTRRQTTSALLTDSGAAVQGDLPGGAARSSRRGLGEVDWSIGLLPALVS